MHRFGSELGSAIDELGFRAVNDLYGGDLSTKSVVSSKIHRTERRKSVSIERSESPYSPDSDLCRPPSKIPVPTPPRVTESDYSTRGSGKG